jgi:hypothetical protein
MMFKRTVGIRGGKSHGLHSCAPLSAYRGQQDRGAAGQGHAGRIPHPSRGCRGVGSAQAGFGLKVKKSPAAGWGSGRGTHQPKGARKTPTLIQPALDERMTYMNDFIVWENSLENKGVPPS